LILNFHHMLAAQTFHGVKVSVISKTVTVKSIYIILYHFDKSMLQWISNNSIPMCFCMKVSKNMNMRNTGSGSAVLE